MTAHALAGDREECLNAGMDDYLSKPIRLTELVEALTRSAQPGDGSIPSTERAEEPTDVALDHEQIARIRSEVGDEVLTIMVDGFAQDTPAQLEQLDGAIASGNTELVRRLAHTVRGSGGYLGATALVARCRALEEMARDGSLEGAPELLVAARSAYGRFAAALASSG
jgi:HPt (histidine-containing phosphotransfer) domain-containing protein